MEQLVSDQVVFKVVPSGGTLTFTVGGVSFKMQMVEGGSFTMGCTSEQGGDCFSLESPSHQVTLSDYFIGQTEVTQGLWRAVMGSNPSYFKKGDNYPVERVSWNDCQDFIRRLNNMLSSELGGKRFSLPTEAQWEYAARGGKKSGHYKYAGSNNIGSVAWYTDNSGSRTHPVGKKSANELGLYDMTGNVWEWCQDWVGIYTGGSQTNPIGAASGSDRVFRGGSWFSRARSCRVSSRYDFSPGNRDSDLGLRLVLL
ncbi:MAG: formylglycine-generating enzyme family protein [Paludibacteraceae bacterium]|nr:formylglycine-generating enzyme family protein [Paludibacteraceae bacterium]